MMTRTHPQRSLKRHALRTSVLIWLTVMAGTFTAYAQITAKWNLNNSGSWGSGANWAAPNVVPNGIGDTANFTFNISSTRTITLDIDPTVGTLILGDTNNTNAFVIGSGIGSGTLIFDNGGLANANNGDILGAYFNHNSGTSGISPNSSDRIDSNVQINDSVGLILDADRNIEFQGAWSGIGTNSVTLLNSNPSALANNVRFYWDAGGSNLGVLSNIDTLNIINGEARFDGAAGVADSQLIGATTINLGNGTLQTDGKVFPRLFLVNVETTQTADLNINGGWLVSDLGTTDDLTIWSGNINFTGAATTNIFDVNDAGTADTHIVTGTLTGTGGFSKVNTGTLQLTANNTLQGNIYIQRGGVGGSSVVSEGSVRLSGADGAFSAINSMVMSRDGSLYLDNSVDVNNDRFNNTAGLQLRAQGRLRMIGNGTSATSETLGALLQETGSGKINFDLDDTTPQLTTLTFASYSRNEGSITQFQVLDNTYGAFGSYTSGNAQLFITDAGANATIKGGGGLNGTTNKSLVVGAYGGVNNVSNHFMTFDTTNTTELRPLKWDGTQAGSEYFLTRDSLTIPHKITLADLGSLDQNVLINYNVNVDGDVEWYGTRPVTIQENIAVNSLRFGTETSTSTTNVNNSNELGSLLVLSPGTHLYLGDSLAANTGLSADTDGSGMILFGRAVDGTSPGSNQFIAGGVLDFGSREALLVNESGNSAFIRSEIRGSGGLTKAGGNSIYLDNSNTYTGDTNIAEAPLVLRDRNALGDSTLVKIEGSGQLYLELGTQVTNSATTDTPPDLYVGTTDSSRVILYSNSSNNTWGGNVIIDTVDNLGNWIYTARVSVNSLATLNLNGNIYGNELLNPINTDITLNDARLISTVGGSSAGGVININGVFSDNSSGPISTVVSSSNENQLLRFQMGGSNELVVNVRQQWNAAGAILLDQGTFRYEGDGNFWTPEAASVITASNNQSGLRMGGNAGSSSNNNNSTLNTSLIFTKAGQSLNISRIDIGGDGTNNFNAKGNTMLAGTNTSGTVTFGDGTGTVNYTGSSSANAFVRDLTVYAAGGGTVDLNFRLDDTDGDSHTSFTKIGRGVVNYNGQTGSSNGDVEQLNMSGGLLRLTNYGAATGTRFDTGAMITLAGGGIEMDGVGSLANETANYTGAAVGTNAAFPTAQTLIAPGGTDVIVTSETGRTTTMNIGSGAIALNRQSGGTVNFVENANGGTSAITLLGTGAPADGTAIAWATYGDTYSYNASSATYTLNALDFAMTTTGALDAFTGASRENTDDISTWTNANDVSEGLLGFTGTTAAAATVNTIHFDADTIGTITVDAGGLEVTSGGIMVSSLVATDTSTKTITGGSITAGADADLIIHQYGTAPLTISSIIADNAGSSTGNALVKTGNGTLILSNTNTYTGRTFLNGGTLSISNDANLGTAPVAPVVDGIYINGGTLEATADFTLDENRGITLGGNGGEISVAADTVLSYGGVIASEPNVIVGYAANPAVGRIDKVGAGTLVLTGRNNTYNGLTDVREGTLKWEPLAQTAGTVTPFGSNSAFLDGTNVHSGATLAIHPGTVTNSSNQNFVFQEWFTFEGGSTLDLAPTNSASDPHDFNTYFRGVIKFDSLGHAGTLDGVQTLDSLAGATVINNRDTVYFGDAGGYITGDGGITKIGSGYIGFRENNPEWTGQLIVNEGHVEIFSAGTPLGVGTMPIILGHNLVAETVGEAVSGNGTVTLTFRDEGGYRDVSDLNQDIIVRADDGAGGQTKRIGARYQAEADVVNFNGSLTLRDDVLFFYQDDARNSADSSTTQQTRNDTRAYGAIENSETVFINFNGNIIGAAGNDITTQVDQSGTANVINGSIDGVTNDDLVLRPIFGLNGDNSAWSGNLTIGNATSDVDTNHIVSIGNDLGISANNNVTLRSNATFQTSGHNVVIGSLTATGTTENYIENASTTAGSITITQSTDATVDVVIRDGLNFYQLQPGEIDAALSFTKAGTAALTLTKGNFYTGTTTLSGGTLRLAYDADNSMLSDTSALILNDGILDLAGTVAHNEIVLSTTINGTVAIERSEGTSIINLNTITRNAGSLRISEDNIATTDNTNVNGILGGWATVGGSWATNSTNGPDGLITGLTTFSDIDRLGGTIANNATLNARIVEAGSTGPVTLANSGTTTIYTLLQGATGGTAVVDIGAANTLRIATGGILLPEGNSDLTFGPSGTLTAGAADNTAGTLFLQSQSSTGELLTIGTVIADNGSGSVDVRTTGPGTTVFTGVNTYTGDTLVGSGTLAIGDGGSAGTLGTGTVKVEASGTLAFNRSDTALSVINPLTGTGTVTQLGTGTTTLNTSSPESSLTFIMAEGTLAAGSDNAINTTGDLVFGEFDATSVVGTLDLTNGSAIAGGLRVQTDTTNANQLIIGTGKTLTVNGDVLIGIDAPSTNNSVLTVTGGGEWIVNKESGTFQVGGGTGSVNGNRAKLDMGGLALFTANLGSGGVFRVGDNNTNSSSSGNAVTEMTLADTSTITAGIFAVGDHQGISNAVATLNLGSVSNVLNVDALNVGDRFGQRGQGVLKFATSTGTLQVRGSDGISRTNMSIINSGAGTGLSMTASVDLTGHSSDLLLNTLVIGLRTGGTGGATSTLSFDTGTLDVSSIVLGHKVGGAGTNTIRGTLNIDGGEVIIGSGGISMGFNGGTAASTGSGTVNFTGGTITVGGDIIHEGSTGAGSTTATFNLTGTASVDMQGHNIGDATTPIDNLILASGTLSNVAEINGGGAVAKTTSGTLILSGTNTYSGGTTVSEGTLLANSTIGSATGSGLLQVDVGATLGGTGSIVAGLDKNITLDGTLAPGLPGASSATLGEHDLAISVSGTGNLTINGSATFDIFANAGGANAAGANDLAVISADDWSNLIFGGSSELNVVTTLDSSLWNIGDSWTLFDWSGIAGGTVPTTGFATLNLPSLSGSLAWDTSSLYTTGMIAIVVPEPSRAFLLLFGILGLGLRRRRSN